MTLLQNNGNLLPLSKKLKVAVIGPNSNATETLLSNYHGARCHDGTFDCITNPYEAIVKKGVDATWAYGCAINSQDTSGFDEAIQNAKEADVAILFMGIDQSIEVWKFPKEAKENSDKKINFFYQNFPSFPSIFCEFSDSFCSPKETIELRLIFLVFNFNWCKRSLLLALLLSSFSSTEVHLQSVRSVFTGTEDVEWIQANVPAILEAFYAGEMASFAIADVLFGDYNPGGKMPYTVVPSVKIET